MFLMSQELLAQKLYYHRRENRRNAEFVLASYEFRKKYKDGSEALGHAIPAEKELQKQYLPFKNYYLYFL